jgi:putative flippase GtrA
MIISDPQERGRFMRFAMVGIIGAAVDFSIFNLLTQLTKIEAIWATVISFSAAVISNFMWNRFWTYPESRKKKVSRQVSQFILVSCIGLVIRTPLFYWLEKVLIRFFAGMVPKHFIVSNVFVGHNLALAIAVIVVMMWNFYANRFWTYNDI